MILVHKFQADQFNEFGFGIDGYFETNDFTLKFRILRLLPILSVDFLEMLSSE